MAGLSAGKPPRTRIEAASFPDQAPHVVEIFREYVASPTVSLDFQNHAAEFAALPGDYAPPLGRLLLAWQGHAVVGCGALRPVDAHVAELKRVYVRPAARGSGLGRALVERLLEEAVAAGYQRVCLDVLPEFRTAQQLYATLGFQAAPPVSFNPVPDTRFLALELSAWTSRRKESQDATAQRNSTHEHLLKTPELSHQTRS